MTVVMIFFGAFCAIFRTSIRTLSPGVLRCTICQDFVGMDIVPPWPRPKQPQQPPQPLPPPVASPKQCCHTRETPAVDKMNVDGALGAARRLRERRLRSAWRHEQLSVGMALAAATHHIAQQNGAPPSQRIATRAR